MRDVGGDAQDGRVYPLALLHRQSAAPGGATAGVRIAEQPLCAAASDQGYDVGGVLAER